MRNEFYNELVINNTCTVANINRSMRENLFSVDEILNNPKMVPDNPVLYRWWVPCDSKIVSILWEQSKTYHDLRHVMGNLETHFIKNTPYYVLYFGKSINGNSRIVKNHLKGTVKTSTLRCTLCALLSIIETKENKKNVNRKLFENTYFEWLPFESTDTELIAPLEAVCIALGNYPLNIEGNCAMNGVKDDGWLAYLRNLRKNKVKNKNKQPV